MKWPWSFWEQDLLKGKYDLIVIGAGYSGLASAYFVKKNHPDWKILVLDKAQSQRGGSTRNAGFACISSLSELLEDVDEQGWDSILQLIEWRWRGLKYIRTAFSPADIEYRDIHAGEIFTMDQVYAAEQYLDRLDEANQQLRQVTGKKYYSLEKDPPAHVFNTRYYIHHYREGQLHPAKLWRVWMKKCKEAGIEILENCEVLSYSETAGEVELESTWGKWSTKRLLQCTNGEQIGRTQTNDVKTVPNMVFVSPPLTDLGLDGNIHAEAGHIYARNIKNRLLIGGGRHLLADPFKSTLTSDEEHEIWQFLKSFAVRHISKIPPDWKYEDQWKGYLGVGAQKQPIIKAKSNTIFILGRLSGMGVALSPYLGEQMAKTIDKY